MFTVVSLFSWHTLESNSPEPLQLPGIRALVGQGKLYVQIKDVGQVC